MKDESPQNAGSSEAAESQLAEKMSVPKWKQRARKLLWPIHARFPNIVPSPYGPGKTYWCEKDAKDNADSMLEEDSCLKLGCIMVSEIFGPSEIEDLYYGLEQIGWDRERTPINQGSNINWLKTQRLYGIRGRMPLGWVHRREEAKKYIGARYTAEFPKEFASLLVTISQLTPSVTCLSVGFILSDEASLEYANEINRPAATTYVPKRRSGTYLIMGATHVKEDRVRRVRQKYRNLGISWLSKTFRGFFGRHCERSHFPTAEFLLLDGFTPFDPGYCRDQGWNHWSRFVNIDHDFGSWTCTAAPSLKFSFDARSRDGIPNHMTIALRRDTLSEDDTKIYGSDSLGSKMHFAYDRLDGIISAYALAAYLRELLRVLKQTRQSLSARPNSRRSSAEVEQISEFFRRSIGVPSIAREVLALSKHDASFRWNTTGFTQQMRPNNDETYEIKDWLKSFLQRLSQQLLEEDRDTREFLNQLSSAMGTKESIAAQRRMEAVTILTLLVAAVSMIIAIYAAFKP